MDIRQRLEMMGFTVTGSVATGEDVLVQIEHEQPALVLMDIQFLGDIDGIEDAARIKENYDIPVVFLTANSDESTIERAKTTDPAAYLLKPFGDRELKTAIEIALHRHKLELELKRSVRALKESEKRYRDLFEQSNDAVIIHDLEGRILDVNARSCELLRYQKDHFLSSEITSFFPNGCQAPHDDPLQIIKERGQYRFESCFERADGEILNVDVSARIVDQEKGLVQGIIRDITVSKRAEQALQESERKYRLLATNTLDVIWTTDPEFNITFVNDAINDLLGYTAEEFTGMNAIAFTPAEKVKILQDAAEQLLNKYKRDRIVQHKFEIQFIHKNGALIDIEITANLMIDSVGQIVGFQGRSVDITERKRAEGELRKHRNHLDELVKERTAELSKANEQLQLEVQERLRLQELEARSQRLEMAGTIAGQVAHDFNNLLAPMLVYPGFIRHRLPCDEKVTAYLNSIEDAATKIAEINQDLMTMGRRGHYNQSVINLNEIVSQAVKNFESRTGTVTCKLNLSKGLMNIMGGSAQIHRMIINLLVNARDAMRNSGQITITTEYFYADNMATAYGSVPAGEYIKLTISDTGCGIPDDIINKILDPFFSTKISDRERGSGLGMSVVNAVMSDHNGYLDLSSTVGLGTSFYLYFPITRESVEADSPKSISGGTESVMIIDDDEIQRNVCSEILESLGYQVSTVRSGEKAVEFLKKNPHDLLILDMIMPPGIDGTETYRQICELYPNQKAIIVSGYSESDRVLEALNLGAGTFVKKPFDTIAIATAVRTELDTQVKVLVYNIYVTCQSRPSS